MAVLKAAKCPNCGAVLSIDPDSEWVLCNFCGVRSSVSRSKNTAVAAAPGAPPVIYVPAGGSATWVILLIVVALGVTAIAAVTMGFQRGGGLSLMNVAIVGGPVLADADGDGQDDIVIQCIVPGDDIMHLRAFSGKDGKGMWVSAPLLKAGLSASVATVPGLVVSISDGATVVGLDATTGKQRFRVTPPERVEAVCQRGNEPLLLTKDNSLYAMNTTTGALTAAGAIAERLPLSPSPACTVARANKYGETGGQMRTLNEHNLAKATGINVEVVSDYQGKLPYLMLGHRSVGSQVPMIGARTAERVLWTSDVPAAEPLAAVEGKPVSAAIANGMVYAAYLRVGGSALRVTSFTLADGRRLWEKELPINSDSTSVELVASDQHVFVYTNKGNDGRLRSLSTATGQLEWSVGG